MTTPHITSVSTEKRRFPPEPEFARQAHLQERAYAALRESALSNPVAYWENQARNLHWFKPWHTALEWKVPHARWFLGGELNVSFNCLDRHLDGPRANKAALIWEGEPGEVRTLTYRQLHAEVCRAANALRKLGVGKGDRVGIYLPMVPEIAVAMLACARVGATHSVVFGGFSAEALRDRMNDAKAKLIITSDGGWRRGNIVPLKQMTDDALHDKGGVPSVEKVLVVKRTGKDVPMKAGRDLWWDETLSHEKTRAEAEPVDSEHPLFILYTSGTTGKPKGVVHSTGGYLVGCATTTKFVFDLKDEDVYWCTADAGWVTGHSYMLYGPLANGATSLMYEGAPNFPAWDRFWDVVERHRVSILYTAPTAIRAFMRQGDEHPKKHDLSTLRLLGTVGEPINPEAWMWYREVIGGNRCPIVDTWWQTETGSIMISPLPGAVATKPGSCTLPMPGISVKVLHKDGTPCKPNEGGYLVIDHPWPSMLRTVWGDDERYQKQYWSEMPGLYFTGDGARQDEDGYIWVMGRIDDVVNVAGHRLGTAEVESALVSHPTVAESAVVARPDELKGQALVAFVTLRAGNTPTKHAKEVLRNHVAHEIGAFAKPDEIRFTDALPKTRSGKIMRRLLRELATSGEVKGDTTTLEDFSALAKLREEEE
ncbi:MAG: acetate--CoA ligase [Myxococcota bacterium]